MDYLKALDVEPEIRNEDDWTEEDDAAIADIIKEIEAQAEGETEEGSGEDQSEVSEGT
jgi:hypothetical protein